MLTKLTPGRPAHPHHDPVSSPRVQAQGLSGRGDDAVVHGRHDGVQRVKQCKFFLSGLFLFILTESFFPDRKTKNTFNFLIQN